MKSPSDNARPLGPFHRETQENAPSLSLLSRNSHLQKRLVSCMDRFLCERGTPVGLCLGPVAVLGGGGVFVSRRYPCMYTLPRRKVKNAGAGDLSQASAAFRISYVCLHVHAPTKENAGAGDCHTPLVLWCFIYNHIASSSHLSWSRYPWNDTGVARN